MVCIVLWSSVLVLFRANGKCNVKLRRVTMRRLYCWLSFQLIPLFFGFEYLVTVALKPFTPDKPRKYNKKHTPNMSKLQFQHVKTKQDLSKAVYFADFISRLIN